MRILHPRPTSGRQRFIGVDFRDGVAEVDSLHPERRLALLQHGYTIQDDSEAAEAPEATKRGRGRSAESIGFAVGDTILLNAEGRSLLGESDALGEVKALLAQAPGHTGPAIEVEWEDGQTTTISPALVALAADTKE